MFQFDKSAAASLIFDLFCICFTSCAMMAKHFIYLYFVISNRFDFSCFLEKHQVFHQVFHLQLLFCLCFSKLVQQLRKSTMGSFIGFIGECQKQSFRCHHFLQITPLATNISNSFPLLSRSVF